jgi:hypothetical protein
MQFAPDVETGGKKAHVERHQRRDRGGLEK